MLLVPFNKQDTLRFMSWRKSLLIPITAFQFFWSSKTTGTRNGKNGLRQYFCPTDGQQATVGFWSKMRTPFRFALLAEMGSACEYENHRHRKCGNGGFGTRAGRMACANIFAQPTVSKLPSGFGQKCEPHSASLCSRRWVRRADTKTPDATSVASEFLAPATGIEPITTP